jgi:hypothetical protein
VGSKNITEGSMAALLDKQIVHELALRLSREIDGRTRIETERRTVFGREVIELRVFLLQAPPRFTVERWLSTFCGRIGGVVAAAGLELAADEGFTPSQSFPSCGFWIASPIRRSHGRVHAAKTA